MNWKETSQIYASKLKVALDSQHHALQLAALPQARQAGISDEQPGQSLLMNALLPLGYSTQKQSLPDLKSPN